MANQPLFLIADDDDVSRLMLSRFLHRNGYDVIAAESGEEAIQLFDARTPDVVLLDGRMPGMDGFATCAMLHERRGQRHIPIMMITGLHDVTSIERAYSAGAIDLITKPIHWVILRHRLRHLLRILEAERQLHLTASVFDHITEGLVITDQSMVIQAVNLAFCRQSGYSEAQLVGHPLRMEQSPLLQEDTVSPARIWELLQEFQCWSGNIWQRRCSGERYLQRLTINAIRSANGLLTGYICVFSHMTSVAESAPRLLQAVGYDALTRLPNRLLFYARCDYLIIEQQRCHSDLALLLLDLDGFKSINQSIGSQVGDQALVMLARRLTPIVAQHARSTLYHLGSDEFAILLPSPAYQPSGPDPVADLAHHLVAMVNRVTCDGHDDYLWNSCSVGIALCPLDGTSVDQLMQCAYEALAEAKRLGGNRYHFYRVDLS
ncbi:MAG: diguanylate cyclase [Magnetococcales bacterium]|nr:diguanylate cyclase [Magnetococcales bacterium]